MTRKKILSAILIFLLFAIATSWGDDGVSTQLHFAVIEARGPRPPFIVDGKVIFTYMQPEPARFIAAAFAHEDFTVMHPYKRYTPEGGSEVFVLAYPVPPSVETLVYRIIVDGLWINDPANSDTIIDINGIRLSRYRIPQRDVARSFPRVNGTGDVTFVYEGISGRNVSVAGSFNSWDPFMYPLRESSPGRYETTLRLSPGEYVYHFIVDGGAVRDPGNPAERYDRNGNRYSYFTIEAEELPEVPVAGKKRLLDRIPFIGGS